ncbi:hypothetical protein CKAH01_15214 [Colletotrichum kahawae]|uniref:CorA-like Mg2+ transporter n=1 Tax=Colletotrichum kahawae TaxID=34407 RepID=A0AAD9YJA9_COLKA|nr:hypothetical protein CKAH01_15214 [Colletotrichum kahawae]
MERSNPEDDSGTTDEAAKEKQQRKSFFSFGDEGVTATVGASGRLLRISRHFPGKKTGFCVDDPEMPEPWNVQWRLETLLDWAENPLSPRGIGPKIGLVSKPMEVVNHRWPTFEGKTKHGVAFKLQYVTSGGIIYQRFEFTECEATQSNSSPHVAPSLPRLSITPDCVIRNLDFVDVWNQFNLAKFDDPAYGHKLTENAFIREHEDGGDKIVLFTHALDETACLEFALVDDSSQVDEFSQLGEFAQLDELEDSVEGTRKGPRYVIQPRTALGDESLDLTSKMKPRTIILAYNLQYLTGDESNEVIPLPWQTASQMIDDLMQPDDEHSLTNGTNHKMDQYLSRNLEYILSVCSIPILDAEDERFPCFALTCGDVDSHRVAAAPSFYAFQFLLLALKHYQHEHNTSASCDCFHSPDHGKETFYICRMMRRIERVCTGHIKWLFQKANRSGGLFCPNYWVNGDEIDNWTYDYDLPQKFHANASFQIIKAYGDMIPVFDLTDNALIWHAMKAAEGTGLAPDFEGTTSANTYSSKHLQQHMLERFTTDDPKSKRRMLAVTRSLVETRFQLRSKDCALFRAIDLGFFADIKPEKGRGSAIRQDVVGVWKATIESQKSYEENNDINWRDPQQFLLGIIMARNQDSINSRSAMEMYEHAMSVLVNATSANGLFPGWLTAQNDPAPYESEWLRDRYWGVTFEIPYALWQRCDDPKWNKPLDQEANPGNTPDHHEPGPKSEMELILKELRILSRSSADIYNLLNGGLKHSIGPMKPRVQLESSSKDFQPFNYSVDEQNIVELQDQWLYNEPTFFVTKASDWRAMDWRRANDIIPVEISDNPFVGLLLDVPKSRKKPLHRDSLRGPRPIFFEEETAAVLNTWNTEIHFSFYRLDAGADQIGKTAQSLNGTHVAADIFSVGKGEQRRALVKVSMGFRFEGDLFDRYWTCRFLDADKVEFSRLVGYHSELNITAALNTGLAIRDMMQFLGNGHLNTLGQNSWQQRRVLELMFFGKMVQRMNLGANEILSQVWLSLRDRPEALNNDNNQDLEMLEEPEVDIFLATKGDSAISRKRIEKVQPVIRVVMGNLEENIAQIASWQNREKDRQAERPRWTLKDENRYRSTIQKLLVSNNHDILRLKRTLLKISKLEESLVKELEVIRSDLEEQRGVETQLFTYVTVVFLPLGFATGIFSMSEAPATQTLSNMILTALGAFMSIALLGLVVKTIISANIVRLPEVTNWTSQDWSNWSERRSRRLRGLRATSEEIWRMDKKTWELAMEKMRMTIKREWTIKKVIVVTAIQGWKETVVGWRKTMRKGKVRARGRKNLEDFRADGGDTERGMTRTNGSTGNEEDGSGRASLY